MDLGLKGKKVILTGGSRGIGRAALEIFAAEGCDVAFFSRNADQVAEMSPRCRATAARSSARCSTSIISMTIRRGSAPPPKNWAVVTFLFPAPARPGRARLATGTCVSTMTSRAR